MRKFLLNLLSFLLVGLIPVVIVLSSYFYFDPFKVLYKYDNYSNSHVSLNRDYVSTEMFVKNNKLYHYNSFIFGSSRTMAYRPDSWIKKLDPNAHIFVFDAHSESIYGIYIKLKYLDETNCKIDNALIIICRDQTFSQGGDGNSRGHMFMKDPVTSHESSFEFQIASFKSYINPFFLFDFLYYKLTHQYKNFMWGNIEENAISYDKKTNAIQEVSNKETEINKNPIAYYANKKDEFYKRYGERTDSVQRIDAGGIYMFNEIARILKEHNTNYKVVLSPLYEQIKYSKPDINNLKSIFGSNLYDFSGKNSFTNSKYNYYESSHYRKTVGDSILNIIYKK